VRWCTIALALAVAREGAADPEGPLVDLSVRLGFGGQAHFGGRTDFSGLGVDLDAEVGVHVTPALTLRVGFERGPRLFNSWQAETDGDFEVGDLDVFGVAELHIDRWFIGAGGGWVQESSTDSVTQFDDMGPDGALFPTYTRSGELVLARAGIQLATVDRLSVNLVMQLSAQRVTGPEFLMGTRGNESVPGPSVIEHAYGVSLGLDIRGPAAKTPPVVPEDRSGRWFFGGDVGLTGALGNGAPDMINVYPSAHAWENAAPRVGLDVGRFVTPSIAIVLDAAGAKAINGANRDDQVRLTIGGEVHDQTLFASAGGGISRYQLDQPGDGSAYSLLGYLGGGLELPARHVRYRIGGELSAYKFGDDYTTQLTGAFTLTFGIRL
jgi:hypothetical protein